MLSEDNAQKKLQAFCQVSMHPQRQAEIKTVIMQASNQPSPVVAGPRPESGAQRIGRPWRPWVAGAVGLVVVAGGLYAVSQTIVPTRSQVNRSTGSHQTDNTVSKAVHKNGTIAVIKPVTYPGQNPDIQIYRMFYWSEGKRVEAYVTEPKYGGPTQYPLLVDCHGGWLVSNAIQHEVNFEYPLSLVAKTPSLPVVSVYPEYRGYADSQGTIQGLLGDTIDTENAIRAADSLKAVNNSMIRLWGNHIGAGVALMVASDPKFAPYTQFVVAISPFVGWDTMGEWSEKNYQGNSLAQFYLNTAEEAYGKFHPSAKAYLNRSPNIDVLQTTPVLLVQGTDDTRVPWQSVQMLYHQMKKAHDPVTLDLIPHGDAGLTGPYRAAANADIQRWLDNLY